MNNLARIRKEVWKKPWTKKNNEMEENTSCCFLLSSVSELDSVAELSAISELSLQDILQLSVSLEFGHIDGILSSLKNYKNAEHLVYNL